MRRVSWSVVVVAALAFVVLAWWRVPWHPVPGAPLQPASASAYFSAEQIDRAESFARWSRVWSWGSLALSIAVACALGFSRWGVRIAERMPSRWWVRVPLTVAVVMVIGRVVTLPFAIALRVHLRHGGLTTQSWSGFARDLLVGELVAVATTGLAVLALVACARRWRTWWPAIAASLAAGLVMLGSFAYPVLIEPLFNSFTPLPDGPLRTQILQLADLERVQVDDVLVADASRRTTTLNAYVSGFGDTRRVVLYDTLVDGRESLDRDEVLSVVAHELTHARYDDVLTGSLLGAAGSAFGVGLLGLLLSRRRREPEPASEPGDARSVPRVLALVAVASLLASPVQNSISRLIETRADVGALEATHDPAAFIALQRQLALRSLADPTPPAWSQFWFGSHPTALQRIALAERFADD